MSDIVTVNSYEQVDRVTKLLDSMEVYILPTMNPDGFEKRTTNIFGHSQRGNANGVDLNRYECVFVLPFLLISSSVPF